MALETASWQAVLRPYCVPGVSLTLSCRISHIPIGATRHATKICTLTGLLGEEKRHCHRRVSARTESPWPFRIEIKRERRFVFEPRRFDFVRNLAEGVLNEESLQGWGSRPPVKHQLDARCIIPSGVDGWFPRDLLRDFSNDVVMRRPAFAIAARIAFYKAFPRDAPRELVRFTIHIIS
jgi:hypothetical protein